MKPDASIVFGEPLWFGRADRPLFGFLHGLAPEGEIPNERGVVLCPPIGYEAWCSYQTFRALAAMLAERGVTALRIDYDGTGSSAGTFTDEARVAAWRDSIVLAVGALRKRGATHVTLVGLRFGATLAALAALQSADELAVQALVLWDAVVSGKRFSRELKALSITSTAEGDEGDDGMIGVSGTVHTKATLTEIAAIDLVKQPPKVRRALVVSRADRSPADALVKALASAGAEVEERLVEGMSKLLEVDNEAAEIPRDAIALIADAIAPAKDRSAAKNEPELRGVDLREGPVAAMRWREDASGDVAPAGVTIEERAVRIGPLGLFAMLGRPAGKSTTDAIVIFLGGGTEHQIGAGRIWVEFARALDARGISTLRADVDGVGDSPRRGPPRVVRAYDMEHTDDVGDLVAWCRRNGFAKIVVAGLCSGAWLSVVAATTLPIDGVFAINPQLYRDDDDPVFATLAEARHELAPLREHELWGHRNGLWSALDFLGFRPAQVKWLTRVHARGVRAYLAYAEGDDGIQSLRHRSGRALARLTKSGRIVVQEVMGIDHGMHRFRKRPLMRDRLIAFVESL